MVHLAKRKVKFVVCNIVLVLTYAVDDGGGGDGGGDVSVIVLVPIS